MKGKTRQVYIEKVADTWMVKYAHRTHGQWYTAAQFYAKDNSLEKVEEWVRSQKNLELVKNKKTPSSDRALTRRVNKIVKKLYQRGEFEDL